MVAGQRGGGTAVKWWHGGMVVARRWYNGGTVAWRHGGMAVRWDGGGTVVARVRPDPKRAPRLHELCGLCCTTRVDEGGVCVSCHGPPDEG
jgi:hypothetical protein